MASASCCAFTIAIGEPFREGVFFVGSFFFNASSALVACSTCALTMAVVFSSLPPVTSLRASRAVSRSAFSNIGSPVSSLMGTREREVCCILAGSSHSTPCASSWCWASSLPPRAICTSSSVVGVAGATKSWSSGSVLSDTSSVAAASSAYSLAHT